MRKLPKALTDYAGLPQWVAWNDANGRKVPKAVGGGNAKSNDPSTWGTLGEAIDEAERNGYTGVGIELDNGLVGIDLDGCVHDGRIEPWAQEMIDEVGSYAEMSPSGTGVHILAIGDPGKLGALGRANHSKGIEVYNHGRYFTVTGDAINDSGIVDATDAISKIMVREFPTPSPEDTLKEELARLARYQVARRANETVSHNVRRDRRSGVCFARVPMGLHTCEFCMMLASRGFVYWSRGSAGEFGHWHADCRCKVVPGVPEVQSYWKNGVHVTRGLDPSVEGYDPDACFFMWEVLRMHRENGGSSSAWLTGTIQRDALERFGRDASKSKKELASGTGVISREEWTKRYGRRYGAVYDSVEKTVDSVGRGEEFLNSLGIDADDYVSVGIVYQQLKEKGLIISPDDTLSLIGEQNKQRDLIAYIRLVEQGHYPENLPEPAGRQRDGVKDIDAIVDGHLVELKSITSANRRAVERAMRSTIGKFDGLGVSEPSVLVNTTYSEMTTQDLKLSMGDGPADAMHSVCQVRRDGKVVTIK